MKYKGKNFNYYSKNQLPKLANLMQFKRVLMPCLRGEG